VKKAIAITPNPPEPNLTDLECILCTQEVQRILAAGINPDEERAWVSILVNINARVLGLRWHTSSGGLQL